MTETTETFKMYLTDLWESDTTQAVGEIAIAFAQLEHVLWILPKRTEELSLREWDALTRNDKKKDINSLCKRVRKPFVERYPELVDEIDPLLNEVKQINEDRKAVIHARWGCKKDKPGGKIKSWHRFWRNADKRVDLQELKLMRDRIRRLRDALNRFSHSNLIAFKRGIGQGGERAGTKNRHALAPRQPHAPDCKTRTI